MPEYLTPGVYVEETSFRAKTIEGVPTSTTGIVGAARYGPVSYPGGPVVSEPRLITSFTEFERAFGGLEDVGPGGMARPNYLAHAARAFFVNGGKRLYVGRVFVPTTTSTGVASLDVSLNGTVLGAWRARWPGAMGNEISVHTVVTRGRNIAFRDSNRGNVWQARGARDGDLVEIDGADDPIGETGPLDLATLHVVRVGPDGTQRFFRNGAEVVPPDEPFIQLIQLRVDVAVAPDRVDSYGELSTFADHRRAITKILDRDDPPDEDALVHLDVTTPAGTDPTVLACQLAVALQATGGHFVTARGDDGAALSSDALAGDGPNADDAAQPATGLALLGEIDEIAIVLMPDAVAFDDEDSVRAATQALIEHAQLMRYRIAIVDPPEDSTLNQVRQFRDRFDSKYAALYYPWVELLDPLTRPEIGTAPRRLRLPPSGCVAGIYARTDVERGVFKAPANEVVQGILGFASNVTTDRQAVLNPVGINALRFFEGRANRVWGARTMTSDPEWKYVNVRRLFLFLEHSIDRATQWAVFEPNNERLWANIRQTVEDFLLVQWVNGALMGRRPAEAYFVRCDRTTMTQNDLDNGRLICLVGVAPTYPAEFVVFRVGQWTADARGA